MKELYGYFAAAYGTCWLVLLALALISQSHIDAGWIGFIGFPLAGILYAAHRKSQDSQHDPRDEVIRLHVRIAELQHRLEHQ